MQVFITDLKQIINRQVFISKNLPELSVSDQKRFLNIKDEKRALQFLVGRTLIFKNFGANFETLETGKIVSKKGFLSLAHSKDFVVLATDDEPVGVDIEKIDSTRPFQKIAKRKKLGICENVKDFYQKWTAYEADFKLSEKSIKPLHQFFEYHGFIICVSYLREKTFDLIEKCPE